MKFTSTVGVNGRLAQTSTSIIWEVTIQYEAMSIQHEGIIVAMFRC